MKKIFVLLIAAIFVLFGCSSSAEDTAGGAPTEQIEAEELNAWIGYWENDFNESAAFDDIEEYTGTHVNYTGGHLTGGSETMFLELADQTEYHYLRVTSADYQALADQGALADISWAVEEYGDNFDYYPDEVWASVTDPETGAIYGIPTFQQPPELYYGIYYREDILKEEGIPVPTTSDELLDATCTLAERGYIAPFATPNSAQDQQFLRSLFGVPFEFNWSEEEQAYIYYGTDPRYLEYLNWVNEMYACGGLGEDYKETNYDLANQRFVNGDSVFISSAWYSQGNIGLAMDQIGVDYKTAVEPLYDMTGPTGIQGGLESNVEPTVGAVYVIPAYMDEYVGQVVQYLNKLASPELFIPVKLGEEGVDWQYNEEGQIEYIEGSTHDATYKTDASAAMIATPNPTYQEMQPKIDDVEYQKYIVDEAPLETNSDYTAYSHQRDNENMQYAISNPMANIFDLPLYNESKAALTDAVINYTWAVAVDPSTAMPWDEYVASINAIADIEAIEQEFNEAYNFVHGNE